jgi:hypothetical protein
LDEHDRTIFSDILEISNYSSASNPNETTINSIKIQDININEFTESELQPLNECAASDQTNEELFIKTPFVDSKDNSCIPIENNLRIYSLEPSSIEIKRLFSNKRKLTLHHNDQSLKNNKRLKPLLVTKKRRCSNDDDDETEQELDEFDYD